MYRTPARSQRIAEQEFIGTSTTDSTEQGSKLFWVDEIDRQTKEIVWEYKTISSKFIVPYLSEAPSK